MGLEVRSLLRYLARHPFDVPVVVGAAWRVRRNAWWRRSPFLPLPGRDYWEFRLVTATGARRGVASVKDVIEYARWSGLQRTRR